MQDLQNGWYVLWKEKNSSGEWEKSNSDYMSKEKAEKIYYIKQKLSGLTMAAIGIFTPFLLDGDATFSLIALPLGLFLVFTKEKVMMF